MRSKLVLLIGILSLPALLGAQVWDDFPWWDSPIVADLKLTPEQHKQIRATVREFRDRLIEQRAAVQKAEAHLMDLMNEEQVQEAKAREMIDKLVQARAELMRTVSHLSLRLRLILTPQQWEELRRRREQQMRAQAGLPAGQPGRPLARGAQPLPPTFRQQVLQRLRRIQTRLQAGPALTPEQRQRLLDRIRELEQVLERQPGTPPPTTPPPAPGP